MDACAMPCPIVPAPRTPTVLTATELRFPFFETGLDAFFGIVTFKEPLLQLPLEGQSFGEAGFQSRLDRALDVADGLCGLVRRRELLRVLVHARRKGALVETAAPDVIDQADPERLFERKQRSGGHQFDRLRLADETGET